MKTTNILALALLATLTWPTEAQQLPNEPQTPRRPGPPPGFEPEPGATQPQRRPRESLMAFIGLVTRPAASEVRAQLKLGIGFGLAIEEVMPGSPSVAAGLRENDILVRLNDQRIVSPEQLQILVIDAGKGKEITLTYFREGTEHTAKVVVGETMMPDRRPMPNFQGNPMRQQIGNERQPGRPENDPLPGNDAPRNERIFRKDSEGRYELQRGPMPTFHVMDPEGKTIWKGQINTPELRRAVPEKYQQTLDAMDNEGGERNRNPQPGRPAQPFVPGAPSPRE